MKRPAFWDHNKEGSWANRCRLRRFSLFLNLIKEVPRPFRILDVGGTESFWVRMGWRKHPQLQEGVRVTILNLDAIPSGQPGIDSVQGDARELEGYERTEMEVVFSNSVIEHVGLFRDQERMAQEIQRVGRRYFVQTPARSFPLEPHFLFPGFQYLPLGFRVALLQRFRLGWMPRQPDFLQAVHDVESVRLLSKREFVALFPRARLYEERVFGLCKSFVAYGGW